MKGALRKLYQKYKHLGIKKNDEFLISYQNSGSTWLRFMIAEVLTGKRTESEEINQIVPFVKNHSNSKKLLKNKGRLIKSHERFRKEYKNKKIVYLVRDPRDIAVSKYCKSIKENWNLESRKKFFEDFVKGKIMAEGRWDLHVEGYLNVGDKSEAEILFVKYEDLKQNTFEEISKICEFLEINADKEILEKSVEDNSIDKMKKKNKDARKGRAGDWKNELSKEEAKMIENKFEKTMKKLGYLK